MPPWNHPYDNSSQSGHRGPPDRPQFRPPMPPRPLLPPRPPMLLRPPLPPLPPPMSAEESHIIDKMAETYNRNPELVAKVMSSQRDNPRYRFLHESSPLHAYYRWRISRLHGTSNTAGVSQRPPMPPPPRPPLGILGSPPPICSVLPVSPQPPVELKEEPSVPSRSRRYFDLPAGLMVKMIDEFHTPYAALRTADLEAPEFLDSIVPGLSDARIPAPEITNELSDALDHFERGVSYIYEEGEFPTGEDSPVTIDREGWEPGVLEKVLWDRRKGSAERRRWERAQAKKQCGKMVCSVSDVSDESDVSESSGDSTSDSGSESDSDGSSDSSVAARPTSVNKALGSDNIGFKMLAKLGWQQGQGLGAAGDGIVEPIRLATRFSTVRGTQGRGRGRGRGRGKGVERASLGTGRKPASPPLPDDGADGFESYRKQMSSVYKNSSR